MVEIESTDGRTDGRSQPPPLIGRASSPWSSFTPVSGLVRSTVLIHFHGCSFIYASPGGCFHVTHLRYWTITGLGLCSRLRGALRGSEEVNYMTINHYTKILHLLSLTIFNLCSAVIICCMSHFWLRMVKLVVWTI
jgi:hypothetical protein